MANSELHPILFRIFPSIGAAHAAVAKLCDGSHRASDLRILEILPTADGALALIDESLSASSVATHEWTRLQSGFKVIEVLFGLQSSSGIGSNQDEMWIVEIKSTRDSLLILDRILISKARVVDCRLRRNGQPGATLFFQSDDPLILNLKRDLESQCEFLEKVSVRGEYARYFFGAGEPS